LNTFDNFDNLKGGFIKIADIFVGILDVVCSAPFFQVFSESSESFLQVFRNGFLAGSLDFRFILDWFGLLIAVSNGSDC
jgi:hypothetical protein